MKLRILTGTGLTLAGVALGWTIAGSQPSQSGASKTQSPSGEPAVRTALTKPEGASAGKPLEMLDWIVGDWVNEGSSGPNIEFSCHFSKNGAFLIRAFKVLTVEDVRLSGMQVIAWDAARETIRSWTYDSDGGFGEDTWSQSGNRYTIRAKYTLPDGGTASAVHVLTFVNDDQCTWKSVSREIDGELQPDLGEIVLVRKKIESDPKGGN